MVEQMVEQMLGGSGNASTEEPITRAKQFILELWQDVRRVKFSDQDDGQGTEVAAEAAKKPPPQVVQAQAKVLGPRAEV